MKRPLVIALVALLLCAGLLFYKFYIQFPNGLKDIMIMNGIRRNLVLNEPAELVMEYLQGHLVPTFIVAGGQKCGTTSMYKYLIQHPQVISLRSPSSKRRVLGEKELRFFDNPQYETQKNMSNYLIYFPTAEEVKQHPEKQIITGESSPNYIFAQKTAGRIKQSFPKMKIILLLRNPVLRSNSHFHHALIGDVRGHAGMNKSAMFEDFVKNEISVIQYCTERYPNFITSTKSDYHIKFHECHLNKTTSLAAEKYGNRRRIWALQMLIRGVYFSQLLPYLEHFPNSQLLILKSEDFFADTQKEMNKVTNFLGIRQIDWSAIASFKHNFGEHNRVSESDAKWVRLPPIQPNLNSTLLEFFEPYNKRLAELIEFSW